MTDYFDKSPSGVKLKCEPAYDEASECDLVYGSYILNSVLQVCVTSFTDLCTCVMTTFANTTKYKKFKRLFQLSTEEKMKNKL